MATRLKLTFEAENRILNVTPHFDELIRKAKDLFKEKLPQTFKVFYYDTDNDLITVTNQADYDYAIKQAQGQLRFYISDNADTVKQSTMVVGEAPLKNLTLLSKADLAVSHYIDPKESSIKPPTENPRKQMEEFKQIPSFVPAEKEKIQEIPEPVKQIIKEEIPKKFDVYACLYCNGEKLTRKGKLCKICEGTGRVPQSFLDRLKGILKKEISTAFQSEYASQSKIMMSQRQAFVPPQVKCSKCGVFPIVGPPFKCPNSIDTYLCPKCEKIYIEEHGKPPVGVNDAMSKSVVYKIGADTKVYKNYTMQCVQESIKDGFIVKPGQTFEKIWKIKNTGADPWPQDTKFSRVTGENINVSISPVGEVLPGAEVDVKATIIAPLEERQYVTYFRLSHGNKVYFGEKPWIDFVVKNS